MTNFNDTAVREAAYYIWKNSGCPTNSHNNDWTAAVHQLSATALYARAANKAAVSKINAMDINAFNKASAMIASKGKKASPLSAASKLMALSLAASTNAALKTTTVKSAPAKSTASKAANSKATATKKTK